LYCWPRRGRYQKIFNRELDDVMQNLFENILKKQKSNDSHTNYVIELMKEMVDEKQFGEYGYQFNVMEWIFDPKNSVSSDFTYENNVVHWKGCALYK
jgi:hypothetical protein